jgi:hypothetical protein
VTVQEKVDCSGHNRHFGDVGWTAALQTVDEHNRRQICMFSVVSGGSIAENDSAATRVVYLLPAPAVFSEADLAPATASVLSSLPGICKGDACALCSNAPLMLA